ncbi:hypothetical protein GALMADRAFT_237443 [Galerina marginata CBS 339.88]|uniref:F-box domain-containing protein n=1 Tax=Galerina marginata (strain CBS 339.88) TaxID=685588 RepID=A0A067TMV8_GALM3|nr:hypothetical protein GALMADRAFT_237443 [Galerina marginata CBS 339.88]
MPPASIDRLPVELQTSILKFLLCFSHGLPPETSDTKGDSTICADWDPRSPSLFPYNVASVCPLWRDILAEIPECWTHVVIDVAKDPLPLLDAVLWSKGLQKLEVVVFNSSEDTKAGTTEREVEKRRVGAISRALEPHLHRCKSVAFDLIWSSSLPPPTVFFQKEAPILEELSLNCHIDDIIVEKDSWTTQVDMTQPPLAAAFPKLKRLSLTGFWFMYLSLVPDASSWFGQVQLAASSSLLISQFQFLETGHYSLENFVFYLSKLVACDNFKLHDLGLSYTYNDSAQVFHPTHEILGSLRFQLVSDNFLSHFFAIGYKLSDRSLAFESCRIPKFKRCIYAQDLTLKNIVDDEKAHSLRHILEAWVGADLTVDSCPSFNDSLLSWCQFSNDPVIYNYETGNAPHYGFKTGFPARSLNYLNIKDCSNFTPMALYNLIALRTDVALEEESEEENLIVQLSVHGRVPVLSSEDMGWFREHGDYTQVRWRIENEQGVLGSEFWVSGWGWSGS